MYSTSKFQNPDFMFLVSKFNHSIKYGDWVGTRFIQTKKYQDTTTLLSQNNSTAYAVLFTDTYVQDVKHKGMKYRSNSCLKSIDLGSTHQSYSSSQIGN